MSFDVQHNTKSAFGKSLSSGSSRFHDANEFFEWLNEQLAAGWPVVITDIRELSLLKKKD